jgi:signal transduction histidine kinase
LGLAISSGIIKNHHGKLTVQNKALPEKGAIFTILLPVNAEK